MGLRGYDGEGAIDRIANLAYLHRPAFSGLTLAVGFASIW